MTSSTEHRALLLQILGVLGVASLGCSTRTVDDEVGDGSDATGDGDGDGMTIFDVIDDTTAPDTTGIECDLEHNWDIFFEVPPECDPMWSHSSVCFYPPEGTACDDEPYDAQCILDAYICGLSTGGDEIVCGPFTLDDGACCYVVAGDCAVGRPFTVGGAARVAGLAPGAAWGTTITPVLDGLSASTRAALASAWRSHGLAEHASVASFARFGLQLMALGAPARLVAASARAGVDERDHAQRCFGLAKAYSGTARQPRGLDVGACLGVLDSVAIAVSLAQEGCVAETVSLMLMSRARDRASDPAVRACLSEIVEDERRHVLLAWEALAWLCRRGGARVRGAVAGVFAEAERFVGFGATTALTGEPSHMRAHGYLSIDERREVAIETLADLVAPAAWALLSTPSGFWEPARPSPGDLPAGS